MVSPLGISLFRAIRHGGALLNGLARKEVSQLHGESDDPVGRIGLSRGIDGQDFIVQPFDLIKDLEDHGSSLYATLMRYSYAGALILS